MIDDYLEKIENGKLHSRGTGIALHFPVLFTHIGGRLSPTISILADFGLTTRAVVMNSDFKSHPIFTVNVTNNFKSDIKTEGFDQSRGMVTTSVQGCFLRTYILRQRFITSTSLQQGFYLT